MNKIFEIIANSSNLYRDMIAIQDEHSSYTYNELFHLIEDSMRYLKNKGVEPKNHVGLCIEHPILFVILFFAVKGVQAVPIPIYSRMGKEKIKGVISNFDIDYIFTDTQISIFNDVNINSSEKFDKFSVYASEKLYSKKKQYNGNLEVILLTSGSTGTPKGVMLSDDNIISNLKGINSYLQLTIGEKVLVIKDHTHASTIVGELLLSLYAGCCVYLPSHLPTESWILRKIMRERIQVIFVIPSILINMALNHTNDGTNFESLKKINFYGAGISEKSYLKIIDKFPKTTLFHSYGLTEASPRVTYIDQKDWIDKRMSVGRTINDVNVMIIGESGKKLKEGELGEVVISGPNVMLGYYGDSLRTNRVLQEGNLFSGDLGYLDSEGFLYLVGRRDNMFISSGKNIFPEEIENVISSFPNIKDVYVFGDIQNKGRVRIKAYIVVNTDYLNTNEVIKYCNDYLEDYKVPHEIKIVKELKKTTSGKIIRNQERGNLV